MSRHASTRMDGHPSLVARMAHAVAAWFRSVWSDYERMVEYAAYGSHENTPQAGVEKLNQREE